MDDLSDAEEALEAADCYSPTSPAPEAGEAEAADFPGSAANVDALSGGPGLLEGLDAHPDPPHSEPHSPLLSDVDSHHGALEELSDCDAVVPVPSIQMHRKPRPKFAPQAVAKYLPGLGTRDLKYNLSRRFKRDAAARCRVADKARKQMKVMSKAGSIAFERH